jgi:hypothetical protein
MNRCYILAITLALAACGATPVGQSTTTTATNAAVTTVAGAEVALTAADQVAYRYVIQAPCAAGKVAWTCSDPATVTKIKSYALTAYTAVKDAERGVGTLAAALSALNLYQSALPPA